MQVVVRPGACLIEGATGYETEDRTMVVQAAGATDRIDSVPSDILAILVVPMSELIESICSCKCAASV